MVNESESSSLIEKSSKSLDSLTEQNWLFIRYFLETGNIKKAHKLAGYKGVTDSAPYMLFKQLKERIDEVGNMDVTSRSRLLAEVNKLLEIPLSEDVRSVTFKERTKLIEVLAKLTPDAIQPKQNLSVFIIKRFEPNSPVTEGKGDTMKGTGTNPIQDSSNIIDVDPIP